MSATMSVSGLVSGLQTDSIIAKIIAAARKPQDLLTANKTEAQSKLTAWQDINTRVLALKMKCDSLSDPQSFKSNNVTSSNSSAITASASTDAVPGIYELKVMKRALASQVISSLPAGQSYTSPTDVVGTGSIVITRGDDTSFTVNIDSDNNTLSGLRNQINNANQGVTASIINAGTTEVPSYKLMLTSKDTGDAKRIKTVATTLSGGQAPTFDTANPVQVGRDAEITMGTGTGAISIKKSSNTISDIIPGVTLNILADSADTTVRLEVTQNTDSMKSAVTSMVTQYNDLMKAINNNSSYDSTGGTEGTLLGSYELQLTQSDLYSSISNTISGIGSKFNSLFSIGITMSSEGLLSVDDVALTAALTSHASDISKIFSYNLESPSSYVKLVSQTGDTKASGATGWNLNVTQVATQTTITAGVALDDNTALLADETLNINGKDISLKKDNTLADIIKTINQSSNDTMVKASKTEKDGHQYLTLTQINYGSSYDVSVKSSLSNSTSGTTGIGIETVNKASWDGEMNNGTGAAGLDVAGTINDGDTVVTCTGKGQILYAPNEKTDTGNTKGLILQVSYTTLPTEAVNLSFSKGIAIGMREMLLDMTGETGIVTQAQKSLTQEMEDLTVNIATMETQITDQQDRLYTTFNAMETKLSQLKSQGDYITATLSASSNSNK